MDRKHAYLVGKGRSLDTLDKGAFKDPDAEVWCVNHAILKVAALGLPNRLVCVQTDPFPDLVPPTGAEWLCSMRVDVPADRPCTRFSELDLTGFEHEGTLICSMPLMHSRGICRVTMLAFDSYFGDCSYTDGKTLWWLRLYNSQARTFARDHGMSLEWVDRDGVPHEDDFKFRQALVSVSMGSRYNRSTDLMAASFLRHNPGWDHCGYRDGDVTAFLPPPQRNWTPFDKCEVSRWLAAKRALYDGKYDSVVYCDGDVRWYGPVSSKPHACLWLYPHAVTNHGKNDRRHWQCKDGVVNLGMFEMHPHINMESVFQLMVDEPLRDPRRFSFGHRTLWLQVQATGLLGCGVGARLDDDPGMDVATWNAVERRLVDGDGGLEVECAYRRYPLRTVHFHTPEKFALLGPVAERLARDYMRGLQ